MRYLYLTCLIFLLATSAAADKPQPKPCPAPPAEGEQPAYREIEVKDPGAVKGRVSYEGPVKVMKWKVVKDREFCGDSVSDESLVVSDGGGLRWVVVSIDNIREGKALPREVKEMANKDCYYQPHVDSFSVCSKMMVTNHDPILHNTHAYIGEVIFQAQKPELTHDGMWVIAAEQSGVPTTSSPVAFTTLFNLGLPNQDFKPKKTLREPGLLTLKCDAGHTWMTAYVWVFNHPYSAVTDQDGEFAIFDVPEGEYTLTFWHETLGARQEKVTVRKNETATVNVTFTAK